MLSRTEGMPGPLVCEPGEASAPAPALVGPPRVHLSLQERPVERGSDAWLARLGVPGGEWTIRLGSR